MDLRLSALALGAALICLFSPPVYAIGIDDEQEPPPEKAPCRLVLTESHRALANEYLTAYQGRRSRRDFESALANLQFFQHRRPSIIDAIGQGPQPELNHEKVQSTLFVLPINDLESYAAARILQSANAPYIWFSNQGWGAKLKREMEQGLGGYLATIPVRRVAIFEIPSIEEEEIIRESGKEVVIYDHHSYESEGIDRSQAKSSLEQLCDDLNWKMSSAEMTAAIADRSFIPGLKKLGLTPAQIIEVRGLEVVIQRNYRHVEDYEYTVANLTYELLDGRSGVRSLANGQVFYLPPDLQKELGVKYKNMLPAFSPGGVANILQVSYQNVSFSGDPRIVEFLTSLDWASRLGIPAKNYKLYSGGDPETRFMNIRFEQDHFVEGMRKQKLDPHTFPDTVAALVEKFVLTLPPREPNAVH